MASFASSWNAPGEVAGRRRPEDLITSGMRADWITMAVRTGESKGAPGIWIIGVPAGHLVGEEGAGFKMKMSNFNGERLAIARARQAFASHRSRSRRSGTSWWLGL